MTLNQMGSASSCQKSMPEKPEKEPLQEHCQTHGNLKELMVGMQGPDLAAEGADREKCSLKADVTHNSEPTMLHQDF